MALCLLEWMADSLCLAMMLRIGGRRIRLVRVLAASALGVLAARLLALSGLARGWGMLLWLPVSALMAGAAGGGFRLRAALVLIACEGLLGGTVAALAGAMGSLPAAWAMGIAACAVMARCAVRERRIASDVHTVRIQITCAQRTASFCAMVDSGNCLRDYLTHRPVIVLPDAARWKLGLGHAALRPIFADTAGGRQMMLCMTPERTLVDAGGGAHAVEACAAFSPGLGKNVPALLPQALLEDAG